MVKNVIDIYSVIDPADHNDDGLHSGQTIVDAVKPTLSKPPMYQVIMLNDDFTPMEFVVEILELFFRKTPQEATRIMLRVHTEGKAVCGTYTRDIAETKASQVNQYSRASEHPLLCEVECLDRDDT